MATATVGRKAKMIEIKNTAANGESNEGTPNQETLEACQELKKGEGISFSSIDELFRYLKNETSVS